MANTFTRGYSFGSTELVTNQKLHSMIDAGTIFVDTVAVSSSSANTFTIGNGLAGNKQISANNGDANLPNLRFNDTSNKWEFSNDGTSWTEMGSGGSVLTAFNGASFTQLASINPGAGVIPSANLPAVATVTDANIAFTDVTTNDSSTTKHGFLKKLSNVASEFMNGQGNWATPAGGGGGSSAVYGTFNYGSLSSGVCSVSHLVSLAFPYTRNIGLVCATVGGIQPIFPDNYKFGATAFSIELGSYLAASNASSIFGWTLTA